MASHKLHFAGEVCCSAVVKSTRRACIRKAYFYDSANREYVCGACKRGRECVQPLRRNTRAAEEALLFHKASVEEAAEQNRQAQRRGDVTCSQIKGMFGAIPHKQGYLTVNPNFKRRIGDAGYDCKRLSPKSLGPVDWYKGLPKAKTIEARMQGTKAFGFELDADGWPTRQFYKRRDELFEMDDPPRHKYGHTKPEHIATLKRMGAELPSDGNYNKPEFCVMPSEDGTGETALSYAEARDLYCQECERLMPLTSEFAELKSRLDKGYNLNIVGYDGHSLVGKTMQEWYEDTSRPFGHEMVLVCLLTNLAPWGRVFPKGRPLKSSSDGQQGASSSAFDEQPAQ